MIFLAKYQRTGNGFKERLLIKSFKEVKAAYDFIEREGNTGAWKQVTQFPLLQTNDKFVPIAKAGTYAYAGGQWHNVKSLDPSILAHI